MVTVRAGEKSYQILYAPYSSPLLTSDEFLIEAQQVIIYISLLMLYGIGEATILRTANKSSEDNVVLLKSTDMMLLAYPR